MLGRWKRPRRVCITGMGCVTPIGIGRDANWHALPRSSALYLFEAGEETLTARECFASWSEGSADKDLINALPIYTRDQLPQLVSRICAMHPAFAA